MEEKLSAYISDVWLEVDHELSIRGSEEANAIWLMVLGIFQSKAEAFGIDRFSIGLPVEDADRLYFQKVAQ